MFVRCWRAIAPFILWATLGGAATALPIALSKKVQHQELQTVEQVQTLKPITPR